MIRRGIPTWLGLARPEVSGRDDRESQLVRGPLVANLICKHSGAFLSPDLHKVCVRVGGGVSQCKDCWHVTIISCGSYK